MTLTRKRPRTKSEKFFYKVNQGGIVTGLPNLWATEVDMPRFFSSNTYEKLTKLITFWCYIFMVSEMGAPFTQRKLSEKQNYDLLIFSTCHPLLYLCWATVAYNRDEVRAVTLRLWVTLKDKYNDLDVERQMLKKVKIFSIASVLSCYTTLISYSINGVLQVIRSGTSFTTVITVWPDIENMSIMANVTRGLSYIGWWLVVIRTCAAYVVVISTTICLSHQYKQLQIYFYKLNEIFFDENLNQNEKEGKYQKSLKNGIKMHSETLQCTRIVQKIYAPVYSAQIAINVIALIILMLQTMENERTLMNLVATACFGSAVLSTTGIFMCSAGDITLEAALLPTAMYSSGWQNCHGTSNKIVRKLLLFAMTQGQQPVVLKAFKLIDMSYQSFVSIVKSSYSVFSVLY